MWIERFEPTKKRDQSMMWIARFELPTKKRLKQLKLYLMRNSLPATKTKLGWMSWEL